MAELEREKTELENERKELKERRERLEKRQERLEERHERLEEERQGQKSQASADVWKAHHQAQTMLEGAWKHFYGQWNELIKREKTLEAALQAESGMYFFDTHTRARAITLAPTHSSTHAHAVPSFISLEPFSLTCLYPVSERRPAELAGASGSNETDGVCMAAKMAVEVELFTAEAVCFLPIRARRGCSVAPCPSDSATLFVISPM